MQRIFCFFSLFMLVVPAQAADLLQIYRQAQVYDAAFATAKAQRDAGLERLPQGRAGLLPTVGVSGNTVWNDNRLESNGSHATRRYNSNAYTLSLSQPVFRWQNWVAYDQGRLGVAQAEAQFVLAQQNLIFRVAQAYFDVLNAEVNLEAAQAQRSAIAQQLELAKKNFEVGVSTIVDTYETQSRYDLAMSQEIAAENELEVKREALRVIIGDVPPTLARFSRNQTIMPPEPANMDIWVEAAQQGNITVQIEQKNSEIASREVEKARAGHYPTLDLVANTGRNKSTSGGGISATTMETDSNNVGLQFNVPLFQGGYVSSKTREAAAGYNASLSTLELARRNAALAVRQSYLGVVNGLAQIKALEAALISSRSSLESNRVGYEIGVRINIDVLNAEQQVFVTRRDLARAYYDTLLARLKLKEAVGSLDESDLEEINAMLKEGSS